jgi:uncharacterized membrane protein
MAEFLFTAEEQKSIVEAIKEAEKNTSGEIQVHVEGNCKKDVLERAVDVFTKLKMHRTQDRNAVLFYLAYKDKKFAILGDAGINSVVPHNFWDSIKEDMEEAFKKGEFTYGLCMGIKKAGMQMKAHFPYKKNDLNELSDEISFGRES